MSLSTIFQFMVAVSGIDDHHCFNFADYHCLNFFIITLIKLSKVKFYIKLILPYDNTYNPTILYIYHKKILFHCIQ